MVDVILQPGELADLFALKTFYNYVSVEAPKFNCVFERGEQEEYILPHFNGLPCTDDWLGRFENGVTIYSDVEYDDAILAENDFNVDISILKNCATPLTLEQKVSLKRRYGIHSVKPILILSYTDYGSNLNSVCELLHAIGDSATVLLAGEVNKFGLFEYNRAHFMTNNWNSAIKTPIIEANDAGRLRDYYAMADVAVNCANISYNSAEQMHNFVEATEGGPLFMVEPAHREQYGYHELRDVGVIKAYQTTGYLIESVARFLAEFKGNTLHHKKRSRHLMRSREKYLPFLVDCMDYFFTGTRDCPEELDTIEIETVEDLDRKQFKVRHIDTDWD